MLGIYYPDVACFVFVVCNPACLCLSEQHFTEVVQGEEFLGLSLQQVCSLISSDKLTVSTEEKVRRHNEHTHTPFTF